MLNLGVSSYKSQKDPLSFWKDVGRHTDSRTPFSVCSSLLDRSVAQPTCFKANGLSIFKTASPCLMQIHHIYRPAVECMTNRNLGGLSEEDDEVCPVECVREIKNDDEFFKILEKAKKTKSLVVVDFYRTACGSCKYIEQGFAKLCKGSGDDEAGVVFLKHNVFDEYDERSDIAERLKIKVVPLFHFYKDGVLLEAFPTRDKGRIIAAINKYTAPAIQNL